MSLFGGDHPVSVTFVFNKRKTCHFLGLPEVEVWWGREGEGGVGRRSCYRRGGATSGAWVTAALALIHSS